METENNKDRCNYVIKKKVFRNVDLSVFPFVANKQ